jgi:hypothetical protein
MSYICENLNNMSIIAYKIEKDKVSVACDGRVLAGDEIIKEDKVKILRVPNNKIICGATGMSDYNDVWRSYVVENADIIKTVSNVKEALGVAIGFKNYIIEQFHCGSDMFNEFGGFFFITPRFHCVINYDKDMSPYITNKDEDHGCFGATEVYTGALLDSGIDMEEAIKMTAKKYITVNDNVYKLSYEL